ncbi:DUF1145 domain-containing protein [Pseudomonas sp. KNUC1026]|uniref:DUF1145 domain-containing protein n=1 Tax=Pseudomonas sp. KNUC1026 TaxID=2893890 RepID=UPI001F366361|nr:DUF1145 domain-containing protein [Pseudomonas sp. KNUC1026]UFH50876.1 DUF1145 domain-containing protein [Pseudomonas sp. KNUC1026]
MLGLFKLLMLLFWWLVVANLLMPLVWPFRAWVNLAGAAMLGLHLLEILAFKGRLLGRSHPGLDRLQILLLGIFHIQSLPPPLPRR